MATPKVLRVLVDLTRLRPGGEGGGIKPALQEMLRWLGRQRETDIHFVYVIDPARAEELAAWLRPIDRLVSKLDAPADLAARECCDLVYCPFGFTDWACPGIPTITLIVDLLHFDFPESLSIADRRYREERCRAALEHTDLFQAISDYTAAQLQKHCGVESGKIIRTYLPIHGRLPPPAPTIRKSNTPPCFFYPANAWAHKNHETLLIAYAIYHRSAGPDSWRLVLTGHHNEQVTRLQGIASTLGIINQVDFLGFVEDSRLAELWNCAGALVFPSLHEGFGIPLLEAMARGVPILASNSTAIPEITSGAALLVDGRMPQALAEGMRQIASDHRLRTALVQRGRQRLSQFSPRAEFGRLLKAFNTMASRPARRQRSGYHAIDGLIGPLAIFGLLHSRGARVLNFVTRPLGVARLLEFWCGPECIAKFSIAADVPTAGQVTLPSSARVLSLCIPDATRLDGNDPRTHGILLDSLRMHTVEGAMHNLLASDVTEPGPLNQ